MVFTFPFPPLLNFPSRCTCWLFPYDNNLLSWEGRKFWEINNEINGEGFVKSIGKEFCFVITAFLVCF